MGTAKQKKEYQLVSRGYKTREDMGIDIPRKFRHKGAFEHFEQETKRWHLAIEISDSTKRKGG